MFEVYPHPGGSPIHWAIYMTEDIGGEDRESAIFNFISTILNQINEKLQHNNCCRTNVCHMHRSVTRKPIR